LKKVEKNVQEQLIICDAHQILASGNCPVCDNTGYLEDPVTGGKIACFCVTGTHVLCVKNTPDSFMGFFT